MATPNITLNGVRLRVLILEDRPADAELLVRALKKAPFDVQWERVEAEDAYRAALARGVDLILADYSLPQFDALRALDILREAELEVPFILVSGAIGEETAIELMKRGMDDFLLKDRLARLAVAATQALRNHHARRQRRRLEEQQRRLVSDLHERVKELTTLQRLSRLLASDQLSEDEVLQRAAELLPGGMQHDDLAAACICLHDRRFTSPGYGGETCTIERRFEAPGGGNVRLVIGYRGLPPGTRDDVFLEEEEHLVDTVAEMLHEWLERHHGQREMARAALMLSNVRDAIVMTDLDGNVTFWNDQAARLFGWSADEMIGRPLEARYDDPEIRARIRSTLQHLSAGEEWFDSYETRRRDGTWIWVESRVTPVRNSQGQWTGFLGISRDISERRQGELALRRARDELRSLVAQLEADRFRLAQAQRVAQIGNWQVDPEGTSAVWSEETYRIFEQDPDTFRPSRSNVFELIHPEDREPLRAEIQQAVKDGATHRLEHRIVVGDGRVKTLDTALRVFRDDSGQPTFILGTVRDITEEKQEELALRSLNEELEARVHERTREIEERENFNRATLDSLSAHVAVLDSTGKIVTSNQAWEDFARANGGDPRQVSHGADYLAVCDVAAERGSVDARRTAEAIRRVLAGELDDWSHEYPCPADDADLWFLARVRPVMINRVRHVLVVHENITPLKRNEARLREALDLAERASQAKSAFLMTMSHELRTPLNGILGMNELLQMTELDACQKEYAEAAEASGKHLLQLINDVLDLSRIEAGKAKLSPERFEVEQLVRGIITTFGPLARDKGLELRFHIAGTVPATIHCDRHRLQQILINLVGNSLKFTDEGEIRVSVEPVEGDRDEPWLRFAVADTGIGIPESHLPQLFKVFSQIDTSTSRRYGGTGLGLSICRELVELMSGRIGVESQQGVGSTFWFEIPADIEPHVGSI